MDIENSLLPQERMFSISIASLPDLICVAYAFDIREAISELFSMSVHLATRMHTVDFSPALGSRATLTVHDRYGQDRTFTGVIETVEAGDVGDRYSFFRITVKPYLHYFQHIHDSRIFMNATIQDITTQIFQEYNFSGYRFQLTGTYEPIEYATMQRENYFEFLARHWAEAGIMYSFLHTPDGHILFLTDTSQAFPDVTATPIVPYNATPGGDTKTHYIKNFGWRQQISATDVTLRDHTYLNPLASLQVNWPLGANDSSPVRLKHNDSPGRYQDMAIGVKFAQFRQEHFRAMAATGRGGGRCPHFSAGKCFTLTDHPADALNIEYLLTEVIHRGSQPTALEEDAGGDSEARAAGVFLTTSFTCIKAITPYRAPQMVRRRADGMHMAIVAGPASESIYIDSMARIKVWFPWDYRAKRDDTSSTWIRVAQSWASAQWGSVAHPRVGDHVLIDYVNGDMDQPIVVGRAYNVTHQPPYVLPDNKTIMTIKSQTYNGDGYNELRFQDMAGQEEVYIHAQKDMNLKIENHLTERVDGNKVDSIGSNLMETVESHKKSTVCGNFTVTIGQSPGSVLGGQDVLSNSQGIGSIAYSLSTNPVTASGRGNYTLNIENNYMVAAGNNATEHVTGNKSTRATGEYHAGSEKRMTFACHDSRYDVVNNTYSINVQQTIDIRCGQSQLTMTADGKIKLVGTEITVDGSKIRLN